MSRACLPSQASPRRLCSRLRHWLATFWKAAAGLAEERALTLLKEHLSPWQRRQYERDATFDVIGGRSGTRYRIHHGYQMNIEQLDAAGRRVRLLCFAPKGRLAIGDIMLAQKLALELYEEDALLAANKIAVSTMLQSPPRRATPPRWPR